MIDLTERPYEKETANPKKGNRRWLTNCGEGTGLTELPTRVMKMERSDRGPTLPDFPTHATKTGRSGRGPTLPDFPTHATKTGISGWEPTLPDFPRPVMKTERSGREPTLPDFPTPATTGPTAAGRRPRPICSLSGNRICRKGRKSSFFKGFRPFLRPRGLSLKNKAHPHKKSPLRLNA